jgi:MraZ protein
MFDYPFSGSGLVTVDASGRLAVPSFIAETLDRRAAAGTVMIGGHEADPCLIAYDRAFALIIQADVERRRIAEELIAPRLHHARARRAFGFVEPVQIQTGTLLLPQLMRRRAGIEQHALIVGTGGTFEIWDAQAAIARGDGDLRELAAHHLQVQQAA